jgi:pre-rRNA-processing protein TSR1
MPEHSHKPGTLKQSNKAHKGLNGKRAKKRGFGPGKVESGDKPSGVGKKNIQKGGDFQDAKSKRLDRNIQMKKKKHMDTVMAKRLGSNQGPPKIVGIIALSHLSNANDLLEICTSQSSWSNVNEVDASESIVHATYPSHKSKLSFLTAQCDNIEGVLAAARVADVLVFTVKIPSYDPTNAEFIDASGYTAISALKAVGCPEIMCCVEGYEMLSGKKLVDTKKILTRTLQAAFDPNVKIAEAHKPDLLCRTLCSTSTRKVVWRTERSYLLADNVAVDVSEKELTMSGYLRGQHLALNSLVHIPGVGTGRIVRVTAGKSPFPNTKSIVSAMSTEDNTLVADEEDQDPLELEADATGIEGEQTWPTEEEMDEAMRNMSEGAGRNRRNVPTAIPSGMSSYQADWFMDEDGQFEDPAKEEILPMPVSESTLVNMNDEDEDDDDDMSIGGSILDGPYHGGSGLAEKQRLRAMADSDMQFPDEKDTPTDQKARERFARYRALQSFRSSPWHPKENLPADYARIYQFENFAGVHRRVANNIKTVEGTVERNETDSVNDDMDFCFRMPRTKDEENVETMGGSENEEEGGDIFMQTGFYINITVTGLDDDMLASLQNVKSLQIFGLHRHENRLSVLHFTIKRTPGYADVIKGKEDLIFSAGFRAFEGKPIFSESNLNCDKHKSERFLTEDSFTCASVYGPITFGQCPLLVFKKLDNGQTILVATGSLMKVDPDRIMLKKVILTGIPIRVRKRMAVVKHLLYDPMDVRWFKPAELCTKHGLRGHIKEPVGTHGLFKCSFSTPITQNDTIMLILYKRVYPKFPESGKIIVR